MRQVSRDVRTSAQRQAAGEHGRIDKTRAGELWLAEMRRLAAAGDPDAAADLEAGMVAWARQFASATTSRKPTTVLAEQQFELPFAYTIENEWVPVPAMTASEARAKGRALERRGHALVARAARLLGFADAIDKHGSLNIGEALAAEGTPMIEGEVA